MSVHLTFATSTLANGTYTATIIATHGADMRKFFIDATVSSLNVVKMVDDPFRSRVYAVHQNGLNRGAIVVFDPINAQILSSITTSRKPSDLAVSNDGTELFVIDSVERAITVIDLATLAVTETIPLSAYTEYDPNYTNAGIKVGSGNILYYTDGEGAPALRVFDRSTRTVLQTIYVGGTNNYGCGDFGLTVDKTQLLAWVQYGWSAGWSGSYIARLAVAPDGRLTPVEMTSSNYPTVLNRDPLDTPVFISNDSKLAFVKQLAGKAQAVTDAQRSFLSNIYAISEGGEIAVTNSAIFETKTGNNLFVLPSTTAVQVVTSDYARLVYFNTAQHAFGTIDLNATIGDTILRRDLFPVTGATVLPPEQLRWHSLPGAYSYDVYLGTSAAAVQKAGPGSPLHLGTAHTPAWNLNTVLTPGLTYFWRFDTVLETGVVSSAVYSFTVSEISASSSEIVTRTVRGHSNLTVPIDLASMPTGKAWQASADVPWISFENASGTTPATLRVVIDASQLTAALHTANISINGSASGPFVIPVELNVNALQLTYLKSAPDSAFVYGISEDTIAVPPVAYLLEIDTAQEKISRVVEVGRSVTYLALHAIDNRIYVPNWNDGLLRAIDRPSLQQVQSYPFAPPGAVGYGQGDVFRITPGPSGRFVVEDYDQWINVDLYNATTGTRLATSFQRQGGGASGPTGRFYYHGDDNISNASLHKFDLGSDTVTELTPSARLNPLSYYGTRLIVASEDGTRIFWNGEVYDQNLGGVINLADNIYSCTADGGYALGETNIYNTLTGQIAFGMPADTRVSAVNSTSHKLVAQVGASIRFYPFASPFTMPAPILSAVRNANGSAALSWTDQSLETGFTIQFRLIGDQFWQNVQATIPRNATAFNVSSLDPSQGYSFRVKADSPTTSSSWSNVVSVAPVGAPPPALVQAVSRKNHGAAGDFDLVLPLSGSSAIEPRSGGSTGDYQLILAFAGSVTTTGSPQATVTSGTASIGSGGVSNGGSVSASGSTITIPLTLVADAQSVTVTAHGVTNGGVPIDVPVTLRFLIGDVNGSGSVSASDVSQAKSLASGPVNASTFRSDVVANGSINSSDIGLVKSKSGNSVSP
ncbi:MAG: fibronectin type III domain-containing protein [Chthoniobacterales bacterium]